MENGKREDHHHTPTTPDATEPCNGLPVKETIFMQVEPSLLAVSCIASATRGLNVSTKLAVGYDLYRLTMHSLDKIDVIVKVIEEIVAREIAEKQIQQQAQLVAAGSSCKEQYQQAPQKLTNATNSTPQKEQPETPTDVQKVRW
uniref:Cyclin C-terminal domain-containing protein n=1 Tax=Anopheles culicifacies TaxID=139723 RepID=A0A182LYC8_9DIPT